METYIFILKNHGVLFFTHFPIPILVEFFIEEDEVENLNFRKIREAKRMIERMMIESMVWSGVGLILKSMATHNMDR